MTYLDFIRDNLNLKFNTSLLKPIEHDGETMLMNVQLGSCPKLDIEIEEVNVATRSVEYRIKFLNYSIIKRIYFHENLSPISCYNRYYNTIKSEVSNFLFDNDLETLKELDKKANDKINKIFSHIKFDK